MNFLSFDIESCDGRTTNGSLCSFGYCLADEKFNILEQKDIIVNPRPSRFQLGRYNKEAELSLAYSEAVFRSSPRFSEVYDDIAKLFKGDVIVLGYSIINDLYYLNNAVQIYKKPFIEFSYIDVQLVYSLYKENRNQMGLSGAAQEFELTYIEHRSDEDARVTLLTLKSICDKLGKDFNELLEHYIITLGKNDDIKILPCISRANNSAVNPNINSKESKKRLRNIFLNKVKCRNKNVDKTNPLNGKTICFNEKFELKDLTYTRRLIQSVYNQGGRYSTSPSSADIFVQGGEDSKSSRLNYVQNFCGKRRKISVISEDDFMKMIDEVPELDFNDAELLYGFNKKNPPYTKNNQETDFDREIENALRAERASRYP